MSSTRHRSREFGLAMGCLCGRYLLKTTDLHYGYWPENLPVDLKNLPTAQHHLSQLILSNIPEGVHSILDVGCGTGALALVLTKHGFRVDCVSPSRFLTRYARRVLGKDCQIYQCTYEALRSDNRYDLVLFSESFQYTELSRSLENTSHYLKPGGYLLICDFFKLNVPGKSVIGGGHELGKFYELAERFRFRAIRNIDITRETAPTLDLANGVLVRWAAPIWNVFFTCIGGGRQSLLTKAVGERFLKKVNKLNTKYFSGLRTAEHFSRFKSYRVLLYQKI